MEQTTPELKTLQAILGRDLAQTASDEHLELFWTDLGKHAFRSLPNQFKTLPITAALLRWQDLKPVVTDQLVKEIVRRWKVFEFHPEEDRTDKSALDLKPSDVGATGKQAEAAALAQQNERDNQLVAQTPLHTYGARRDWFDSILDFVIALGKPIQALFT